MLPATGKPTNAAQIRELMDAMAKAVRAKDVNASVANYAPECLSFDLVSPLQRVGSEAARKRAEEWFASWQGSIEYDIRDLTITTENEIAFCHSLNHVRGTKTDGQIVDMWWRSTLCFRKEEGEWLITHEHLSVPFDMNDGKAALNLKP